MKKIFSSSRVGGGNQTDNGGACQLRVVVKVGESHFGRQEAELFGISGSSGKGKGKYAGKGKIRPSYAATYWESELNDEVSDSEDEGFSPPENATDSESEEEEEDEIEDGNGVHVIESDTDSE